MKYGAVKFHITIDNWINDKPLWQSIPATASGVHFRRVKDTDNKVLYAWYPAMKLELNLKKPEILSYEKRHTKDELNHGKREFEIFSNRKCPFKR